MQTSRLGRVVYGLREPARLGAAPMEDTEKKPDVYDCEKLYEEVWAAAVCR